MKQLIQAIFLFTCLTTNYAQTNNNMEETRPSNPLLCDIETGICEVPNAEQEEAINAPSTNIKPIKVIYFTDPICSSCWGIEPQLRRLKMEYKDYIEVEYHMGGLLPDWSYNSGGISKPSDVAHHWDEVSEYYDMPIDGDVWLDDPLPSSYPPSIAFKAAEMQDEKKALVFLRKLREFVFLQKKNITKWEHIEAAALYSGLDAKQLKADYEGKAEVLFKEDLALGKKLRVRGFPSMFFVNDQDQQVFVYGSKPYAAFENAVLKLIPEAKKAQYNTSFNGLFSKYPTWTIKEYSVCTGSKREQAAHFLEEQFKEGKLGKIATKNGDLYLKK